MNDAEVRNVFAAFCGADRYRQFIATYWSKAVPKQRLVFWQERLWREFAEASAAAPPASFAEVRRVFQVCPRHLEPLELPEPSRVPGVLELLRDVPEDDRMKRYPFAVVLVTHEGVTKSLSCPMCVAELEAPPRGGVNAGE